MARDFECIVPARNKSVRAFTGSPMQELVLIQPSGTLGKESAREAAQAEATREFEAQLAGCGPLAYRVARGVLRNSADAEDVAQEALLRAYRSSDRLRDRNRFRAWLVRITFRLALDRFRSAKRREQRETLWAQPVPQPTTEDLAASNEFSGAPRPRPRSSAGKTAPGSAAFGHGRPHPRRSRRHARFACGHREIKIIFCPETVSGEAAMPCEKYQAALIELAASGAEPDRDLRAHLDTCVSCAELVRQERLLLAPKRKL